LVHVVALVVVDRLFFSSAFQCHDNFLETFPEILSHLAMNRLASCKGSSLNLISFAGLARGVNTPWRAFTQPGIFTAKFLKNIKLKNHL
jgi:hypothetical protein